MIKIMPQDIEGTYLKLLSPRSKGEELKEQLGKVFGLDQEDITKVKGRVIEQKVFGIGEIPLPSPLKSLYGDIFSDGNSYSGRILIDYLSDLSDQTKKDFFSTIQRNDENIINIENGLVFLYDKDPFFVLKDGPTHNWFDLSFGRCGTLKRTLTSLEQFETDFKSLTDNLTKVINAAYQKETPDINYRLYL